MDIPFRQEEGKAIIKKKIMEPCGKSGMGTVRAVQSVNKQLKQRVLNEEEESRLFYPD